jgi:hypothetical protein
MLSRGTQVRKKAFVCGRRPNDLVRDFGDVEDAERQEAGSSRPARTLRTPSLICAGRFAIVRRIMGARSGPASFMIPVGTMSARTRTSLLVSLFAGSNLFVVGVRGRDTPEHA